MKGIDVSTFQGKIDWKTVKSQVDFAIVRAGFGNSDIDKWAVRNLSECKVQGIPVGAYWFSYAFDEATARREAASFNDFVREYKPEYPVYFDWEYDSDRYAKQMGRTVSRETLGKITHAFCSTMEGFGWYCGVYANPDYIKNRFPPQVFKDYDLWLAHYAKKPFQKANIWQYSSTGTVKGIQGNVDMNVSEIDYPTLIKSVHLNGW